MTIELHIFNDEALCCMVSGILEQIGFCLELSHVEHIKPVKMFKVTGEANSFMCSSRVKLLITNSFKQIQNGVTVIRLSTYVENERKTKLGDFSVSENNEISICYVNKDDLKSNLVKVLALIRAGIAVEHQQSLFYQAVTQYSHDGIICVDEEGIVTVFNNQASEILGVSVENAIGKPLISFNPTAGLPRVLHQREIELEDIISVNGRMVAANRVPICISGEIVGAISTFQDVTRLQKYEQMVRRKLNNVGFEAKFQFDDIVAIADSSRRVKDTARQCGEVDATVLITGESGTGKELFAQSMHNISPRARGPFVAVNCAALPDSLLESELFGYDEGAFTGANRGGKQGLFELAHGGTLFLDEIGELPLSFQGRLLRVLQQREVLRVGGKAMIPVDVRVIAATHQPLQELVQKGAFRSDLFYRLYVLSLHVPPLRERKEDIIPLTNIFVREFMFKYRKSNIMLSDAAYYNLIHYDWPGNIRELRNVIERAVVMTGNCDFVADELIQEMCAGSFRSFEKQTSNSPHHSLSLEDIQLLRAYEKTSSVSKCADTLGMHRTTVWRHLKKLRSLGYIVEPD